MTSLFSNSVKKLNPATKSKVSPLLSHLGMQEIYQILRFLVKLKFNSLCPTDQNQTLQKFAKREEK